MKPKKKKNKTTSRVDVYIEAMKGASRLPAGLAVSVDKVGAIELLIKLSDANTLPPIDWAEADHRLNLRRSIAMLKQRHQLRAIAKYIAIGWPRGSNKSSRERAIVGDAAEAVRRREKNTKLKTALDESAKTAQEKLGKNYDLETVRGWIAGEIKAQQCEMKSILRSMDGGKKPEK